MLSFQYGWYLDNEATQKQVANSGYLKYTDPVEYKKFYNEFCEAHGNSYLSEGGKMNTIDTPFSIPKSGDIPEVCKNLDEKNWIEIQDNCYGLFAMGNRDVNDIASDKSITRLYPVNTEWSMQLNLASNMNYYLKNGVKAFDMYVMVKSVNKKAEAGNVLTVGVWSGEKGTVFEGKVNIKDINDNKFCTVYLGEMPLFQSTSNTFFIAPEKNPTACDAIEIDRVVCVLK